MQLTHLKYRPLIVFHKLKYPTASRLIYIYFLRHYVLRWRFKCFVKLYVPIDLVEYRHSSVVKVLGL